MTLLGILGAFVFGICRINMIIFGKLIRNGAEGGDFLTASDCTCLFKCFDNN